MREGAGVVATDVNTAKLEELKKEFPGTCKCKMVQGFINLDFNIFSNCC